MIHFATAENESLEQKAFIFEAIFMGKNNNFQNGGCRDIQTFDNFRFDHHQFGQ